MIRLREHLGLLALLALLGLALGACSDDAGELTDDDSATSDDDDSATSDDDDSATSDDDDSNTSDDDDSEVDSDSDGTPDEWDCGPDDPNVFPGAPELCNGVDDNCDGALSEMEPDERDLDADGFPACAGDCEDGNPAVHPGAADTCDGIDSDCDGYPEDIPTGSGQEMFISSWGHLYITILSVDAGCDIYLDMNAPVPVADMVGEVHSAVGVEVDVGAVLPCTEMLFTAIACGSPFNSSDPSAFRITPQGENHWLVEVEDGYDNDYNDLVFEALVEPRDNIR